TILSVDRSALAHQIEDQLKEYALWADLGIEVMGVSLASIHPPIDIADIYQSVVSAGNQKRAAILTAEGGAMAAREQAQADKQVSINQAGITRDERVSAASAEIIEYNAEIEAYELDREVYRLDRYLDTVERALAGRKKYLIGGDVDVNSLYSGAFSRLPGALLEQKQAQADGAGEGEAG
ncbi:MAG: SPFH domain-containing protein, partial [Lawsonibacter sp.]